MGARELLGLLAFVAVLAVASSDVLADEPGEITIHTASVHVPVPGGANDLGELNPWNFGAGYNLTSWARVGAFYNSYRKPSTYAAAFYDVAPWFRVGAGVITGYKLNRDERGNWKAYGHPAGILPLFAAEIDVTRHLSVAWFGQAFNLELKW